MLEYLKIVMKLSYDVGKVSKNIVAALDKDGPGGRDVTDEEKAKVRESLKVLFDEALALLN